MPTFAAGSMNRGRGTPMPRGLSRTGSNQESVSHRQRRKAYPKSEPVALIVEARLAHATRSRHDHIMTFQTSGSRHDDT